MEKLPFLKNREEYNSRIPKNIFLNNKHFLHFLLMFMISQNIAKDNNKYLINTGTFKLFLHKKILCVKLERETKDTCFSCF